MPKCILLVGVPASGKSTWIENRPPKDDAYVASTDWHITDIAEQYGMTYDEAFKDLIGFAEKAVWKDLEDAAKCGECVYIDRTNLSIKTRRKFIDKFKLHRYEIECIVFPMPGTDKLPTEEWNRRLDSRPGKTIPGHILSSMIEHYEVPTEAEGFSKITFL